MAPHVPTETIPAEILKRIKRIHITTGRLVANVFAGEYKSVFKGRGLEFHEVREYYVGDDTRMIDWNVSARTGKLYLKRYVEERELTVMLLLDASRSAYCGSARALKREVAAEVCALLAGSASRNNDRVGLIIFTDRIEKFIPPRKGFRHILRVIREALYFKPTGKGTDIPLCIEYLNKVTAHSTISFLISDFYAHDIKKPLAIANKRHDLVSVIISDPRDLEMPDVGVVALYDAETGKERFLDTTVAHSRKAYSAAAAERLQSLRRMLHGANIDTVDISTTASYVDALSAFFKRRRVKGKK